MDKETVFEIAGFVSMLIRGAVVIGVVIGGSWVVAAALRWLGVLVK